MLKKLLGNHKIKRSNQFPDHKIFEKTKTIMTNKDGATLKKIKYVQNSETNSIVFE